MVTINTVFLVGSNYIPCRIWTFIFVIICLILRNKLQKHEVIYIMQIYIYIYIYNVYSLQDIVEAINRKDDEWDKT